MKAIYHEDSKTFLKDWSTPKDLAPNELLLQVLYVGICKTDLSVAKGKIKTNQPLVLGHEASARVLAVGQAVKRFQENDLVSIIPMSPCGECAACQATDFDLCSNSRFAGVETEGYLTEQVVLPERYLYAYPAGIHPLMIAYTEPVAAALAVLNFPALLQGNGLILGENRFSKLIALILQKKAIFNVTISDRIPKRGNFDFVIETGLLQGQLNQLLAITRRGGSLIIRSRANGDLSFNAKLLLERQIRIQGVSYSRYQAAIDFIVEHERELLTFVGDIFELEDFERAFLLSEQATAAKNFIKVS